MNHKRNLFSVLTLCFFFWSSCVFCAHKKKSEPQTRKYLREITLSEENSGMESIDCIYVINLDKRPEKYLKIKAQFDKVGLHLNRVSGVEGYLLTKKQLHELSGPYRPHTRPGEYGCLLSHVSIYEDAYKRGFSRIWILEDDALIEKDVNEIPQLLSTLSFIDPKWDIFYTDSDWRAADQTYHRPKKVHPRPHQHKKHFSYYQKRKKVAPNIQKIRSRWGMHSYILSKSGIKKMRDYFVHQYIWTAIDWDLILIPKIRQYSSLQDIVTNPWERGQSDTLGATT